MTPRELPERCPRCQRTPDTWTFSSDVFRRESAGCPCGEVIPIGDEPLRDARLVPRPPVGWIEESNAKEWRAKISSAPSRKEWALFVGTSILTLALGLSGNGGARFVAFVLVGILLIVVCAFAQRGFGRPMVVEVDRACLRLRRWIPPVRIDVAIPRILRVGVVPTLYLEIATIRRVVAMTDTSLRSVFLVVECKDERRHHLPFPGVLTPEEARYVADRVNAMLESGGRSLDHGYRGDPTPFRD